MSSRERGEYANHLKDINRLLDEEDGRRVLYRVLLHSGVLNPPPMPPYDPTAMAYDYGKRSIGQQILFDILSANPNRFVRMLKDAKDVETTRQGETHECHHGTTDTGDHYGADCHQSGGHG